MKFFSIVLATLLSKAAAFPSGAGACPAGEAAPGGSHLTGTPGLVGALSEGNYVVTVGGTPVAFDGTPIEVPLDFDIEVTAEGTEFKGILIRVGGASGDQVTSPDLTAPAGVCGDVGSVTHSDNSPKTVGTASVALDAAATLDVDISVVLDNAGGSSTFYFSTFQLTAVGGEEGGEPTTAPAGMTPEEPTTAPAGMTPEEPTTPPAGMTPEEPTTAPAVVPTSNAMDIGGVAAALAGVFALFL